MAAKQTTAEKKVAAAAAKAAREERTLSPQEAHNLLQFLDRVAVTGINESVVMTHLAKKLMGIKGSFEAPDGDKNSNPTS